MRKKLSFPIDNILEFIRNKDTAVFLETSKQDKENNYSYIFTDPLEIITAHSLDDLKKSFKNIQKATAQGIYACGHISYEAGYAVSSRLSSLKIAYSDIPLLWMGLFRRPIIYDHRSETFNKKTDEKLIRQYCPGKLFDSSVHNIHLAIRKSDYISKINRIKRLIENGDTYQVNFTTNCTFKLKGDPLSLYKKLRGNQPVSYGALIKNPDFNILSFSPELFFRREKDRLTVKPMKGTISRGFDLIHDKKRKELLASDSKNQAENIMIVDLLRNDIGRISRTGSVKVKHLFEVEKYKTLFQMTSTISSRLEKSIGPYELFLSLFPSGSVTGAPKIRTMQIINQLETSPRKVYTGAIGYFGPKNKAVFNVAIRTVQINGDSGQMGIGSGITYSSVPRNEYDECLLKAQFLILPEFKLIETMLWKKGLGIPLLDLHLKRLRRSAVFFGYKFSKTPIMSALNKTLSSLSAKSDLRVRLLFDRDSNITIETSPVANIPSGRLPIITLSKKSTKHDDLFLYHKNTNRRLYDTEHQTFRQRGFFDVIFTNEKGQITEGAITNIFILKDSQLYTPPIECGVLPGVYRSYLMNTKNPPKEKILYPEDLNNADAIFCSNAVRGLIKVKFRAEE